MSLIDHAPIRRLKPGGLIVKPIGDGFAGSIDGCIAGNLSEPDVHVLREALARHKLLIWHHETANTAAFARLQSALANHETELSAIHVPGFPELMFVEASNLSFEDRDTRASVHVAWRPNTIVIWDESAVNLVCAETPQRHLH